MQYQVRTLACRTVLLMTMPMTLFACGGRQTMASRSAAAYDEATKKGIPAASGEHGGHIAEAATQAQDGTSASAADQTAMSGMDHTTKTGMDHDAMKRMDHPQTRTQDHGQMSAMEHSKMQSGKSAAPRHDMAEMDQGSMSGMQHGQSAAASHSMAGMDHASMPAVAPASMEGMQHGSATPPAVVAMPPTSNASIAQIQPAATLRADEFDAPSPDAIAEAAKGAAGMSHSTDGANPAQPDRHAPQPPPPPEHHHHGKGEAS